LDIEKKQTNKKTEETIQGQTLSAINEISKINPNLTREKTILKKVTQTTMECNQRKAIELAANLAIQ